ncbi:hypothetical protein JCM10213_008966 [Rhodosporidiobolus nylandii]
MAPQTYTVYVYNRHGTFCDALRIKPSSEVASFAYLIELVSQCLGTGCLTPMGLEYRAVPSGQEEEEVFEVFSQDDMQDLEDTARNFPQSAPLKLKPLFARKGTEVSGVGVVCVEPVPLAALPSPTSIDHSTLPLLSPVPFDSTSFEARLSGVGQALKALTCGDGESDSGCEAPPPVEEA